MNELEKLLKGQLLQEEPNMSVGEPASFPEIENVQPEPVIDPKEAQRHFYLGYQSQKKGNLEQAIREYETAIEHNPHHAWANYNRVVVVEKQKEIEQEVIKNREILNNNPSNLPARENLGDALVKQGKLDEAIKEYRKLIELSPDWRDAHYKIGYALRKRGDLEQAVQEYRIEIKNNPDDAMNHNILGIALKEQGETDLAILEFTTATTLDPRSSAAHYNLGKALEKKGYNPIFICKDGDFAFKENYKMTIGVSFAVKTININGKRVKLQIWDTGGQERFQYVRPLYYKGTMGCILLFDLTNRESFDHLPKWIEEVQKESGSVPMLLVGNKSDLKDARALTREEAQAFADDLTIKYVESSAKSGEGIGDVFKLLSLLMIGEEITDEMLEQGFSIIEEESNQEKSSGNPPLPLPSPLSPPVSSAPNPSQGPAILSQKGNNVPQQPTSSPAQPPNPFVSKVAGSGSKPSPTPMPAANPFMPKTTGQEIKPDPIPVPKSNPFMPKTGGSGLKPGSNTTSGINPFMPKPIGNDINSHSSQKSKSFTDSQPDISNSQNLSTVNPVGAIDQNRFNTESYQPNKTEDFPWKDISVEITPKKCPKCGANLRKNYPFCNVCGMRVPN